MQGAYKRARSQANSSTTCLSLMTALPRVRAGPRVVNWDICPRPPCILGPRTNFIPRFLGPQKISDDLFFILFFLVIRKMLNLFQQKTFGPVAFCEPNFFLEIFRRSLRILIKFRNWNSAARFKLPSVPRKLCGTLGNTIQAELKKSVGIYFPLYNWAR